MTDFDPPKVKHIPLQQPRAGVPGEVIYLDLWRNFAITRPHDWHAIFQTNGPVRQRAASVAASFMVYMGCNGGRGFTHTAEKFAQNEVFLSRERAFLAAWAVSNARQRGVNSGLRMSEYMLSSEHPIKGNGFRRGIDWKLVPNITQEDNDILESMVAWWSTPPAGVLRRIAEPAITSATEKLKSEMFKPVEMNRVAA